MSDQRILPYPSFKNINGDSIIGTGNLVVSAAAAWGGITGTLSSQTDLQTALNAKGVKPLVKNGSVTRNGTITTDQDWFDTPAAFALEAGKKYYVRGWIQMSGQGATSHAIRVGFTATGGLTFTDYYWQTNGTKAAVNAAAVAASATHRTTLTSTINCTAANATNGGIVAVEGFFHVNAAGSLTPIFSFSAAPSAASFTAKTFMLIQEL